MPVARLKSHTGRPLRRHILDTYCTQAIPQLSLNTATQEFTHSSIRVKRMSRPSHITSLSNISGGSFYLILAAGRVQWPHNSLFIRVHIENYTLFTQFTRSSALLLLAVAPSVATCVILSAILPNNLSVHSRTRQVACASVGLDAVNLFHRERVRAAAAAANNLSQVFYDSYKTEWSLLLVDIRTHFCLFLTNFEFLKIYNVRKFKSNGASLKSLGDLRASAGFIDCSSRSAIANTTVAAFKSTGQRRDARLTSRSAFFG